MRYIGNIKICVVKTTTKNIIQRTSISQQVMDHILNLVERGELRPDDRLPPEREFAASLGISRVPLREAISALCVLGVLDK